MRSVPAARLVSRSSGSGTIESSDREPQSTTRTSTTDRAGVIPTADFFVERMSLMNIVPPDPSGPRPTAEHLACLGLGSNVDPAWHLRRAIQRLREAVAVEAVSMAWESPAVGADGPDYVNAALLVRTPLSKEALIGPAQRDRRRAGSARAPTSGRAAG